MEKRSTASLKSAWLILTPRCNNRCQQCYQGEKAFPKDSDMPFEYTRKILTLLGDLRVKKCILIGGEPTLHKDLDEIVGFGSSRGVKMGVMTNGSVFASKKRLRSCIENGLRSFSVSVEGPNAQIHEEMTKRKGSFLQAIRAIKNGMEFNLNIASLTTLSVLTKNRLIDIYEAMREIGLPRIAFNICTCSLDRSNTGFLLPITETVKGIEALFRHIYRDLKSLRVESVVVTPLPACMFERETLNLMRETRFFRPGCGCHMFFGSGIAFNFDGEILPCCHWIDCSLGNVMKIWPGKGSISPGQFQLFWNERGPAKFRQKLIRYPSKKCVDCSEWGTRCVGGCPLLWLEHNAEECIPGLAT